jgi:hypothetical protein
MSHPVVLALFDDAGAAAAAARELRTLGVPGERISIVARSHDDEGVIARDAGASPGSEIEDSEPAARLGELSAHLIAAIALVMPGIGPIVADGPLAAGLGEAAGHLAGGIGRALERAGISHDEARDWESRIQAGAILVGAHIPESYVARVQESLIHAGSRRVVTGSWPDVKAG